MRSRPIRVVLATTLAVVFAAIVGPPTTARAFDGAFKVIDGGEWDVEDGPVPFALEPNGSADVADGSDLDAVRSAFRAWQCVDGVTIRFEEQTEVQAPAEVNLEDGINSVFWDETGAAGLGPGVLGVNIGDTNGPRTQADIVFNGADSAWSTDDGPTQVDVGSIAIHEIGHFLGLDHPCDGGGGGVDGQGNETNCNGGDRSIMTPAWDGSVQRQPLPDDEEGVRAIYPAAADDPSTCDGPFRKGEKCSCDQECVDGLVCAGVAGGQRTCAPTCAADNVSICGGDVCAFEPPEGDEPAPGVCIKRPDQGLPPGALCTRSSECAVGTCSLLFELAHQICQRSCDSNADCDDGGRCFEGFCLASAAHELCPDPDKPQGCGCSSQSSPLDVGVAGAAVGAVVAAGAGARRRRRRRRPAVGGCA